MSCQKCNSNRIASIQAKHSDCFNISIGDKEHDGYAPEIENVCGGDYTRFELCLDCGQVQGTFPITTLEIEELEDDANESISSLEDFYNNYFNENEFVTFSLYRKSSEQLIEIAREDISKKFSVWLKGFLEDNERIPSMEIFVKMFKNEY